MQDKLFPCTTGSNQKRLFSGLSCQTYSTRGYRVCCQIHVVMIFIPIVKKDFQLACHAWEALICLTNREFNYHDLCTHGTYNWTHMISASIHDILTSYTTTAINNYALRCGTVSQPIECPKASIISKSTNWRTTLTVTQTVLRRMQTGFLVSSASLLHTL